MSSDPAVIASTNPGTATRNDWKNARVSSPATKLKLLIISGPSGAGKSTVVRALLSAYPHLVQRSVSVTTRPPRPGEVPGVDYHFWTKDQFLAERDNDAFLEYKEVFGRGDWYGTLRREVEAGTKAGRRVLLEIDVEGMKEVLAQGVDALTVFIHPGSMQELEKRLRARATDSEEAIQRRLEVAQREMDALPLFQHEVINDDKNRAVTAIAQLLATQHQTDQVR
jgi:guanylate kinase